MIDLEKDMRKEFERCVNELKDPLLDMSKEYSTGIIMGAMLEVSLRMLLMSVGTAGDSRYLVHQLPT